MFLLPQLSSIVKSEKCQNYLLMQANSNSELMRTNFWDGCDRKSVTYKTFRLCLFFRCKQQKKNSYICRFQVFFTFVFLILSLSVYSFAKLLWKCSQLFPLCVKFCLLSYCVYVLNSFLNELVCLLSYYVCVHNSFL